MKGKAVLLMVLVGWAWGDSSQYCRALSLEGGGSRGAYEAGALMQLTTMLAGEDITWNVVTGISTGALNSGMVAQFPMGSETEMAQYIQEKWLSLNGSESVFVPWPGCDEACAILEKPSLYTTGPLRNTLSGFYTNGIHRNITVGSSNLDIGMFGDFNETVGGNLIEAVMCSAAPPLFFPPQNFLGSMWADGGCIVNLDVFKGIERCLDVVEDESSIIVDMIFCEAKGMAPLANGTWGLFDVMGRVKDIKAYDKSMWYLYNAVNSYPEVNFRYVIVPSKPLPGGVLPLDFNQTNLINELALGKADAEAVITNGGTAQVLVDVWHSTSYNQAKSFSRA